MAIADRMDGPSMEGEKFGFRSVDSAISLLDEGFAQALTVFSEQ